MKGAVTQMKDHVKYIGPHASVAVEFGDVDEFVWGVPQGPLSEAAIELLTKKENEFVACEKGDISKRHPDIEPAAAQPTQEMDEREGAQHE